MRKPPLPRKFRKGKPKRHNNRRDKSYRHDEAAAQHSALEPRVRESRKHPYNEEVERIGMNIFPIIRNERILEYVFQSSCL